MVGRAMRLILLKLVHTVVLAIAGLGVMQMLYSGISGHLTWFTLAGVLFPAAIWIGIKLNGNTCILQVWARRLQNTEDWVSDIYIPDWMARRVLAVMTPAYFAALGLLAVRGALQLLSAG